MAERRVDFCAHRHTGTVSCTCWRCSTTWNLSESRFRSQSLHTSCRPFAACSRRHDSPGTRVPLRRRWTRWCRCGSDNDIIIVSDVVTDARWQCIIVKFWRCISFIDFWFILFREIIIWQKEICTNNLDQYPVPNSTTLTWHDLDFNDAVSYLRWLASNTVNSLRIIFYIITSVGYSNVVGHTGDILATYCTRSTRRSMQLIMSTQWRLIRRAQRLISPLVDSV